MSSYAFFEWLTSSPWANAMNGPEWAFPVVESLHFIGFALLIGTIAIVDFRLLGLMRRLHEPAELAAALNRFTLAGLALMLTTGPLMFSADAVRYHVNPSFQIKMNVLLVTLVFYFAIHRRLVRRGLSPMMAKVLAVVSLTLWTTVIGAGRMIAFV